MTISIIGAGTYATGGGNLTPTLHASTAENDLLIAFANKRAATDKLVPPGGWSTLYQHPETATNGNASEMTFYAKIAGASESSPTFTATGTTVGTVQVLTARGDFGTNIAALLSVSDEAGSQFTSNLPYPALTITNDNTLVLYGGKYRDSNTATPSANTISGFTQVAQTVGDLASGSLLTTWNYQIQTAATNISAGSWTISGASTSPSTNAAIAVSITEAATSLKPDVEPLYLGATLLASKTGVEYRISSGHAGIDGDTIVSGTSGTTDGSGVFQLPSPITTGAATDPVTVALYWEEGSSPVTDRSIVVKTTLIESA